LQVCSFVETLPLKSWVQVSFSFFELAIGRGNRLDGVLAVLGGGEGTGVFWRIIDVFIYISLFNFSNKYEKYDRTFAYYLVVGN
jgi:hypothetical protein